MLNDEVCTFWYERDRRM